MADSVQRLDETVTKRREFLAALREEPATKPELVDRLGASRSTVDRAIGDLEQHNLVTRPEDEYELTIVGRQAHEEYESYLERLENLQKASEVIANIPPDADFDAAILEDAEVTTPELHDPGGPLDRTRQIMEKAAHIQRVTPAVFPVCVDLIGERTDGDLSLELFVPRNVIDTLQERYGLEDERQFEIYEIDETPPYALWLAETPDGESCGLMAHSETGIHGLVVSRSEDACEWVRSRLASYQDRASRVELY